MNSERLQFLISAYLDGALLPEEKSELEQALRTSSAARTQFWEQTRLHDQLRTVVGESGLSPLASAPSPKPSALSAPLAQKAHSVSPWLTILRRPLAAMAAGIVISALGTSAVWSYAAQRTNPKAKPIPLLSADFEGLAQMPALGVPKEPNTWSGDYSACVGAENGIQPHSGKKMLRFLRADNALAPKSAFHYVAEAIHVIDLRPFRAELLSGNASIEIGSWFASVTPPQGQRVRFLIKAATFTGTPQEAAALWEESSRTGLSLVQQQADPSPTPGQWKSLSVTIPVPPNTDFLVFECAAMQVSPKLREGTAEFPGHYLDDVTVSLRQSAASSGASIPPFAP